MTWKISIAMLLLIGVVAIVTSEKFCPPRRSNEPCPMWYRRNDCCKQSDCRDFDICCKESCGYVCRRAVDKKTSGVALKDGTPCIEGFDDVNID